MIRSLTLSALACSLAIVACSSSSTPDTSGSNNTSNNGSASGSNGSTSGNGSNGGSSSNNTGGNGSTTDGGSTSNTSDAGGSNGNDAGPPHCGDPGDMGNDIGVGKYCTGITDCIGNKKASLCATLGGDPTQTFCTTMCKDQDAGDSECGMDATCECQGGQCGCYPNKCL